MIKRFVVGALQTNCYIIYDEENRDAMVVDPGFEDDEIINTLSDSAPVNIFFKIGAKLLSPFLTTIARLPPIKD